MKFELPVCKKTIELRLQTPAILDDITKEKKSRKDKHPESLIDQGFVLTLISCIRSIDGQIISPVDLEIKYDKLVGDNLNGFAPKRSIPTVKQAILYTCRKYLGLESARGGIMYIQNMIVTNYDIFAEILSTATEKYKPIHEMEVNAKCDTVSSYLSA